MPETNISHMKFLTAAASACLVMFLCAPAAANAQNPREQNENALRVVAPKENITGSLFDRGGRPREGVAAPGPPRSWTPEGPPPMHPVFGAGVQTATTNDLGEYRLYWIPPGDYYLVARDNAALGTIGFAPTYVTTYYPGTHEAAQAAAIKVPPGAELGGTSFTMSQTHTTNVTGLL